MWQTIFQMYMDKLGEEQTYSDITVLKEAGVEKEKANTMQNWDGMKNTKKNKTKPRALVMWYWN